MSLRPGSVILNSLPPFPENSSPNAMEPIQYRGRMAETIDKPSRIQEKWGHRRTEERKQEDRQIGLSNGFDVFECPPPKTENEVRCYDREET